MKFLIAILSVSLAAGTALGRVQDTSWVTYTSAEGRYTVSVPTQPRVKTQATSSDGVKFTQYLAVAPGTSSDLYQICYFDVLPNNTFSLEKARDGMVHAVNGTLLSDKATTFAGFPGRHFTVAAKFAEVDYIVIVKFCQAGGRIYLLEMAYPKSSPTDFSVAEQKFFDSFTITK